MNERLRSAGVLPSVWMRFDELLLFILPSSNEFCGTQSGNSGCEQRQTERFRSWDGTTGVGVKRREHPCDYESNKERAFL